MVSETGSCTRELSTDLCPDYSGIEDIDIIQPDSLVDNSGDADNLEVKEAKDGSKDNFKFQGQKPLSLDEASSLAKDIPITLISFVGPVNVGKTTLISSIYDAFGRHNLNSLKFGKSLTISAFERLCHSARSSSQGREISTPRTSTYDEVKFYHIAAVNNLGKRVDLLLADRSGENYIEMVDDISLCKTYAELKRSDLICFLVDASKLIDMTQRHKTRAKTTKFIDSLYETQVLTAKSNCILLATKYDEIASSDAEEQCRQELQRIVDNVRSKLSIEISPMQIAARPCFTDNPGIERIDKLLSVFSDSKMPKKDISQNCRKFTSRSFHNLELIHERY
ncbi:TRAFAC clade GTPase domain-containing protein [Enterovibrio nigricans]|nr:GTPase [Enterovibrio nigricans]